MLRQLYLIFLLPCLTFTLTWAEDSGKKVKVLMNHLDWFVK